MTFPPPLLDSNDEESLLIPRNNTDEILKDEKSSLNRLRALQIVMLLFLSALLIYTHPFSKKVINHAALQEKVEIPPLDYLPKECPGYSLINGINDPRDIDIISADLSGLSQEGFDSSPPFIFDTDHFNKHSVQWLIATKAISQQNYSIHMVLVEVRTVDNKGFLCTLESGEFPVDPRMILTRSNVYLAWSGRQKVDVSTCDTCPGYGVKNVKVAKKMINYDPTINKYQFLNYLPNTCPGKSIGYAQSFSNISVMLVDSYADIAYMGGNNIDQNSHQSVVFLNTALDETTKSYYVAYVDFPTQELRMVEARIQVIDGQVYMCAPQAKVLKPRPELTDHNNIIDHWNSAAEMNVASCRDCAGFGVSAFKFSVADVLDPTPLPSAQPVAVPTLNPTLTPTLSPTLSPTNLPDGWYLAPDEADGIVDGKSMIVQFPIASPTMAPNIEPTFAPISNPSSFPVSIPTYEPTFSPTDHSPTLPPVVNAPTPEPTSNPIPNPSMFPVVPPTMYPVQEPTHEPVVSPTFFPTIEPTPKSSIILGRPCDVSDDFVDGGLTIHGQEVPDVEPTFEPTLGPTYSANVEAPPTLAPTLEPSMEPTLGPTFNQDAPPTYAPSFESTPKPTVLETPRVTFEPCLDSQNNLYASPSDNMMQLDTSNLKSCDKFPGFKSVLKLVSKIKPDDKKTMVVKPKPEPVKAADDKKPLTPTQQYYYEHFYKKDQDKIQNQSKKLRSN